MDNKKLEKILNDVANYVEEDINLLKSLDVNEENIALQNIKERINIYTSVLSFVKIADMKLNPPLPIFPYTLDKKVN